MDPVGSAPPTVSVVIPARNAGATLPTQLDALRRQHHQGPWEVVVVDNGSTDDTAAVAARWTSSIEHLRVVTAPRPPITRARNAGVAAAEGELVVFCDADDEVDEHWLATIVDAAGRTDLVGGHLSHDRLNRPPASSWRRSLTEHGLPRPFDFLPHVVGANFAVWRSAYLEVGGCDESFGAGDDVDLSWRLQLAGASISFAPDALVHYRLRSDLRAAFAQSRANGVAAAKLYERFRHAGMQRPPLAANLRYRATHLADLPRARRTPEAWGRWCTELAHQLGRLEGAARHRVAFW